MCADLPLVWKLFNSSITEVQPCRPTSTTVDTAHSDPRSGSDADSVRLMELGLQELFASQGNMWGNGGIGANTEGGVHNATLVTDYPSFQTNVLILKVQVFFS